MQKKPLWFWNIFFLAYVFFAVGHGAVFFQDWSPHHLYYQLLVGFNRLYMVLYLCNVLMVVCDILAIIPFYYFLNPSLAGRSRALFSRHAWVVFLSLRLFLLGLGQSYNQKHLISLYLTEPWVFAAVVNLSITIYGPSYLANFLLAIREQQARREA